MPPQRNQELTREQRASVITLHLAGFKTKQIQEYFEQNGGYIVSPRQIYRAINAGHPTPQKKKNTGRKGSLLEEQVDEIEAYVTSSKAARFLSWAALSVGPLSHFEVSGDTLQKALGKRGYKRHVAR